MYNMLVKAFGKLHRGQKGITGLETAIILIAFVTVASVLGYSVLSAGIFSAERGKETVYRGLEQAQASMDVKGSVIGLSTDDTNITTVQFVVGSVLKDEPVDMTDTTADLNVIVINYSDQLVHEENVTWSKTLLGVERGDADMLEADEQMLVTVTLPLTADVVAYSTFNLQIIPNKGASITIRRTVPGLVTAVTDMH